MSTVEPYFDNNFLLPTLKIQSDSDEIKVLLNELVAEDDDSLATGKKVATWISQNIKYDNQLAESIFSGYSDTQDAISTLKIKKGTCSECTNLFIALMRCKGIPCKFICGHLIGMGYHAWAEFYSEKNGWIAVDPQGGCVGVSDRHKKLFEGVDFPSLNIILCKLDLNNQIK